MQVFECGMPWRALVFPDHPVEDTLSYLLSVGQLDIRPGLITTLRQQV